MKTPALMLIIKGEQGDEELKADWYQLVQVNHHHHDKGKRL